MNIQVVDKNYRTKDFNIDGTKMRRFIQMVLKANPQGIKEISTYRYKELIPDTKIAVYISSKPVYKSEQ